MPTIIATLAALAAILAIMSAIRTKLRLQRIDSAILLDKTALELVGARAATAWMSVHRNGIVSHFPAGMMAIPVDDGERETFRRAFIKTFFELLEGAAKEAVLHQFGGELHLVRHIMVDFDYRLDNSIAAHNMSAVATGADFDIQPPKA